jgi:hypothetical protein
MITIEADFNRLSHGRLVLSRLAIHEHTPFAELAATGDRILFVQGEDIVQGKLVEDPELGWLGDADWDTQDVLRSYPSAERELEPSVS